MSTGFSLDLDSWKLEAMRVGSQRDSSLPADSSRGGRPGDGNRCASQPVERAGPPVLYAGLLGASWAALHPEVRQLHSTFAPQRMQGSFEVYHAPRLLARWVIRRLHLPGAGAAVPVLLEVVPAVASKSDAPGESWRRRLGDVALATCQWAGRDGLLCERFGLLEFRFQLEVRDGALVYVQRSAALRLGQGALLLPWICAPRILAREEGASLGAGVNVNVEVHVPWLGLLFGYRGSVSRAGGDPR